MATINEAELTPPGSSLKQNLKSHPLVSIIASVDDSQSTHGGESLSSHNDTGASQLHFDEDVKATVSRSATLSDPIHIGEKHGPVDMFRLRQEIEELEERLHAMKDHFAFRAEPDRRESRDMKGFLPSPISHRGQEMRLSIPRVAFTPWPVFNEHALGPVPAVHNAVDVPINEPTTSQLRASMQFQSDVSAFSMSAKGTDARIPAKLTSIISQDHYVEVGNLPERIRINSQRIEVVLDFDLMPGDTLVTWDNGQNSPLCILRPFKLLNYLEQPIRTRLRDYEEARYKLKPGSDEFYAAEYDKDPAEDRPRPCRQDESSLTLSELTGFVNDLRALIRFIDHFIEPAKMRLQKNPGLVRFSDLWYVFPQGALVVVKDKDIPQKIWKVIQRNGGRRYLSRPDHIPTGEYQHKLSKFVIDCYHLDYDGIHYVPTYQQFIIQPFEGSQPVSALPVFPFDVAVKDNLLDRQQLLRRGQQFMESTKICHRYYSGRSESRTPSGVKLAEHTTEAAANVALYSERIDSEVIVDFERALQEVPEWRPGTAFFSPHVMDINECGNVIEIDRDNAWDARLTEEFMEPEERKWHRWEKQGLGPESEEDILLLPGRVFAFVLRTRRWACLKLGVGGDGQSFLRKIMPRPEPWNNLELPEGHKHIVQSLIESHFAKDNMRRINFDLVRGKGKGVIILLHGVPGVGKTSTAECAAESNNRPLLPITCGDLGLTPKEVETKLQDSFQLAQAWGCVMLLDEADIFLAQRTVTDTQRNALVSVFLRALEYYEGILFLTTNRVGTFDEAFKSRIHISLYYPPLDWTQTEKIWETHLRKAMFEDTRIETDNAVLMAYARELFQLQNEKKDLGPTWNGRQIRNAFQTAVVLAGFKSRPGEAIKLEKEHFEKVSNVSNHFNNYLWRVKRSMNDADIAKMGMLRADDYNSSSTPEQYTPQIRSTFGQGINRATTPTPVPISPTFMMPMPAQPMYQMSPMIPGQNQPMGYFSTQIAPPQFQQQPQPQQRPLFQQQTSMYGTQQMPQAQYQQQQQQQFGGVNLQPMSQSPNGIFPGQSVPQQLNYGAMGAQGMQMSGNLQTGQMPPPQQPQYGSPGVQMLSQENGGLSANQRNLSRD